ncbi:hypothetical protein [Silicimonas sp. MF1-12-2]|jgi:hypothetical protein|uniref:hypothetical protein n=1 Tax=Silicimonas sp. MF1-12-2 TaxID=3384793 RepID=UPI0039B423CC
MLDGATKEFAKILAGLEFGDADLKIKGLNKTMVDMDKVVGMYTEAGKLHI